MKINPEHRPLDIAVTRDDLDFWDWYTRRLLRDPMFRRDLPAQKSFSKLRSAIAGLYTSRGMRREAERAFQEARTLYPVSPEANFRLIQEVLMPQGRHAEAIFILEDYNRKDPNNDRGRGFIDFINRLQQTHAKVRELTAKAEKSDMALTAEETFELALAYRELGQTEAAANCLVRLAGAPGLPVERMLEIGKLLSALNRHAEAAKAMDGVMGRLPQNVPPDKLLDIVRVFGEARQTEKMLVPLSRYLQAKPDDWQAWLDMATLCAMRQQQQQTRYALQKAIESGKMQAVQRIQENQLLRQVAEPLLRQMMRQGPAGLPPLGMRGR